MKKLAGILPLLSILFLTVSMAHAGAGSAGSEFLSIGIGARAISMGGAFTGLADDVSAAYWNPGGMAGINGLEVLTMYNTLFEGMSQVYAGAGKKIGKGVAGIQVNYVTSGNIDQYDINGNPDGSFSVTNMAIGLSYAWYLNDKLSLGFGLKNVSESIAGLSGSGMAVDAGLLDKINDKLSAGLAVQNAGTGMAYAGVKDVSPFPTTIRAGVIYIAKHKAENSLVLDLDISKATSDDGIGAGVGGEYKMGMMAFRLGAEKVGDSMNPGAGVGIESGNILVDIAMVMDQELGSTYKVSLIGRFGSTAKSVSVNKVKASAGTKAAMVQQCTLLEKQLQQAIDKGDFEKADGLNKKIEQQKVEKAGIEKQLMDACDKGDFEKADELNKKLEELKK